MGSAREVIPPLRRPDGSWATTSLDKARLLADTFATKSRLDDEQTSDYSDIIPEATCTTRRFGTYTTTMRTTSFENSGRGERNRPRWYCFTSASSLPKRTRITDLFACEISLRQRAVARRLAVALDSPFVQKEIPCGSEQLPGHPFDDAAFEGYRTHNRGGIFTLRELFGQLWCQPIRLFTQTKSQRRTGGKCVQLALDS